MLRRTHLAIGIGVALYFLPHINNKYVFLPFVIIFSLIPDLDRSFGLSKLLFWKKDDSSGPNHRGFFHSYTACILFSFLLALFYPLLALPFFLGYSMHLFADSFTVKGIKPFWPLKFSSSGVVTTGGKSEISIFWIIVVFDIVLLLISF